MNKALIIGRLGADPEIKLTTSGKTVCNLSIATSESWTDKDGQKHEKTEWHKATCWDRSAEIISQYCKKGSQLAIEGKIQTRSWDDEHGNKRYSTEIAIQHFELLGGRQDG